MNAFNDIISAALEEKDAIINEKNNVIKSKDSTISEKESFIKDLIEEHNEYKTVKQKEVDRLRNRMQKYKRKCTQLEEVSKINFSILIFLRNSTIQKKKMKKVTK